MKTIQNACDEAAMQIIHGNLFVPKDGAFTIPSVERVSAIIEKQIQEALPQLAIAAGAMTKVADIVRHYESNCR